MMIKDLKHSHSKVIKHQPQLSGKIFEFICIRNDVDNTSHQIQSLIPQSKKDKIHQGFVSKIRYSNMDYYIIDIIRFGSLKPVIYNSYVDDKFFICSTHAI
jgi:hypothetical protein